MLTCALSRLFSDRRRPGEVMRRIGLTMHYRRFLPHCISSSHRNMSVISTKFNPIANKYEDDVRKCIANVSSITYMFTQTPLLTHSRTKVKETVTNSTISSLGCISSIKIQENNVIIDLDLLIAGYPHRYPITFTYLHRLILSLTHGIQ